MKRDAQDSRSDIDRLDNDRVDEHLPDWLRRGRGLPESPPRVRRGPTRTLRDRRGKILDAALTLFNEAGYARASMQDIAREAGASIGSVYHHFEGKEHIAAAIYVAGLADYHRGLARELLREHETAEDAVKALVRHHLSWVKRNKELARFLLTSRDPEVVGASARELGRMNAQVFAAVEAWMERWVKAGEVQRMPIDLLHSVVLGPSQEFCRHWAGGRTKQSIDEAEPVLADAAWKAVRA
jgi:AcrR family transcriptional regulator